MSIDPKFSELIQADIDGEISAEDKQALEAFLADSAEGRELHESLVALTRDLDTLDELEPPTHLKHVIMNMAPTSTEPQSAPGMLERFLALPALHYAGTFAAGVVVAVTLFNSGQISSSAFDDMSGLVGTVGNSESVGPALSSIALHRNEIAGTVNLRSTGPLLVLDFDVSAQVDVEVIARYEDRSIWFNGFAQLESEGLNVAASEGLVSVQINGKRRYAVFLNNPDDRPATIEMQFLANGELIHTETLDYRAKVGD